MYKIICSILIVLIFLSLSVFKIEKDLSIYEIQSSKEIENIKYDKIDDNLLKILNSNEISIENNQYITDKICQNLNIKVENNETTVSLRQITGGAYTLYILADIKAPENVVFDLDYFYKFSDYFLNNSKGENIPVYISINQIPTNDNLKKNEAVFLFTVNLRNNLGIDSILNENLIFSFQDFQFGKKGEYSLNTLPGKFNFNFKLNIDNISNTYDVKKDIPAWGDTAYLETISISPFSITAYMYDITEEMIKNSNTEYHKLIDSKLIDSYSFFEEYPIKIKLLNGREIEANSFWQTIQSGIMKKTYQFSEIINLDEIRSVTICESEIPINELIIKT